MTSKWVALPSAVVLPSAVPSAVVLLTAVAFVLGLGLGDVDVVHPAHPTANARAITTIKLAAIFFFIFIPPDFVLVRYKRHDDT